MCRFRSACDAAVTHIRSDNRQTSSTFCSCEIHQSLDAEWMNSGEWKKDSVRQRQKPTSGRQYIERVNRLCQSIRRYERLDDVPALYASHQVPMITALTVQLNVTASKAGWQQVLAGTVTGHLLADWIVSMCALLVGRSLAAKQCWTKSIVDRMLGWMLWCWLTERPQLCPVYFRLSYCYRVLQITGHTTHCDS